MAREPSLSSSVAPLRVFQFATGTVEGMRTTAGRFSVRAIGEPVPLGSLPLATVQPAIRDALAAVLAVSHHRRDVGGRSRWARLGPVATLYRSGFYGRYYNGALTMARDLLL